MCVSHQALILVLFVALVLITEHGVHGSGVKRTRYDNEGSSGGAGGGGANGGEGGGQRQWGSPSRGRGPTN